MPSIVMMLKRKPGMSMKEFRHHYETSHAAMAVKYMGDSIADYRRSYVHTQANMDKVSDPESEPAFDAVTVISFDTPEQMAAFAKAAAPHREEFLADEYNFLDRDRSYSFQADLEVTSFPRSS